VLCHGFATVSTRLWQAGKVAEGFNALATSYAINFVEGLSEAP